MGIQRLHNAELIEFLSQLLRIIAESGNLPAKVAETLATLRSRLAELEAMHKTDPSSLITSELVALDEERDDLYTGLLAFCRSFVWHNNEAIVQQGAALVHCIDNYGVSADVTRKPYSDESATIQSLLTDLARPQLQDAVAGTGAGLWIDALRAANERFRERFLARNDEDAAKEFLVSIKQKRREVYTAYYECIDTLNAARIMGEQGLDALSGKINALTETQRQVIAQRKGRAEAGKTPAAPQA